MGLAESGGARFAVFGRLSYSTNVRRWVVRVHSSARSSAGVAGVRRAANRRESNRSCQCGAPTWWVSSGQVFMQAQDVAFGVFEPRCFFRAEHADMFDGLEPRHVVVRPRISGRTARRRIRRSKAGATSSLPKDKLLRRQRREHQHRPANISDQLVRFAQIGLRAPRAEANAATPYKGAKTKAMRSRMKMRCAAQRPGPDLGPPQPPTYSDFRNSFICASVIMPPLAPMALAFMS